MIHKQKKKKIMSSTINNWNHKQQIYILGPFRQRNARKLTQSCKRELVDWISKMICQSLGPSCGLTYNCYFFYLVLLHEKVQQSNQILAMKDFIVVLLCKVSLSERAVWTQKEPVSIFKLQINLHWLNHCSTSEVSILTGRRSACASNYNPIFPNCRKINKKCKT